MIETSFRSTDVAAFDRLGIPSTLLEAAQVRRVTSAQARDDIGIRYGHGPLDGIAFPYVDPEHGRVVTARVRRDHPERDSAGRPVAKYVSPPDRHRLYFPPGAGALLADTSAPVVVVEAEKSSLALTAAAARAQRRLLVIATGGCWGWRGVIGTTTEADGARVDEKGPLPDLMRITWADRDVILLFDANASSNTHVRAARRALAQELTKHAAHVRIADLPAETGINGPDDYLAAHADSAIFTLLENAKLTRQSRAGEAGDDRPSGRESQATQIVRLALAATATVFHDDDVPYLSVRIGSHDETHPLRSRTARAWLVDRFFRDTGKAPGSQALADATNTLEAHALNGTRQRVDVRISPRDAAIYLDLDAPDWRVVEVTGDGWRVIDASPVPFRRPRGLRPLPEPVRGGSIVELRPLLNLVGETDWVLVVAWLLGALRGRGPYPLLIETGEHDAGKSSAARFLRDLVDPNAAPLRGEPRDARDLMIAATNAHILNFDNLSTVSRALSDDLCRLATGGGFSTRALYENREEEIFDAARPVILNGISDLATRPDLVSRGLFISFPPLCDSYRRTEDELKREFSSAQPRILGALLDAVALALSREHAVQLPVLPRMADFARWVVAAEPLCPWPAGRFLEVYAGNRQLALDAVLDGDVVADLARALCDPHRWSGTATELLAELNARADKTQQRGRDWLRTPRQIADALRRLAPALRRNGVDAQFRRAGHGRMRTITLEQVGQEASASSARSADGTSGGNSQVRADAPIGSENASSAWASAREPVFFRGENAADAADAEKPRCSNRDAVGTPSPGPSPSLTGRGVYSSPPDGQRTAGRVHAHRREFR